MIKKIKNNKSLANALYGALIIVLIEMLFRSGALSFFSIIGIAACYLYNLYKNGNDIGEFKIVNLIFKLPFEVLVFINIFVLYIVASLHASITYNSYYDIFNSIPTMVFTFCSLIYVAMSQYFITYFSEIGIDDYFLNHSILKYQVGDKILRFIIINAVVLIMIVLIYSSALSYEFNSYSLMLSFMYAFFLEIGIFYSYNQKKEKEYKDIIDKTRAICEGDYNYQSEACVIYEELDNNINHIRDGFKKAVEEEIKSQSMKHELITNVSHDLKTPITGMSNYIELLQDEKISNEKRKEYIDIIDKYNDRLKKLVENLFDVSKANTGNLEIEYQDVDIISFIKQVEAETKDNFKDKEIKFVYKLSDEEILIPLDSNYTYRIFENIFINISKYTLENTRVYIDIEKRDKDVQIVFKNISKEEMNFTKEEIVERFVRGDKSRHESGSGLGLAIVQSFVELQGGKYYVDIDGDLFKNTIIFKLEQNNKIEKID